MTVEDQNVLSKVASVTFLRLSCSFGGMTLQLSVQIVTTEEHPVSLTRLH